MDALRKLQHINALSTLHKAIENAMEKKGISEDQITLDIESQKENQEIPPETP